MDQPKSSDARSPADANAAPADPAAPQERSDSKRFLACLLMILATAAAWRTAGLTGRAFDHDEVYEITTRTLDLGELAMRHDGFPPLYRWLVSAAIEAADSPMASRWFSVAAGVLGVGVTGLLGWRLAGPNVGLVAAAFLGWSANHVLLSQHGRAYSLLVLFASLMMLTAWRLRDRDGWPDWLAFLASSWLAIATHYYAGLLLLLLGPLLLLEKRGPALRRAIAAAGLLAVAGLPLVVCLRADLADSGEFFHRVTFDKEAYAFSYLWLVTGNTHGPSITELRELVADGRTRDALLAMAPTAATFGAIVGWLMWCGWGRLRPRDRAWLLVLLIAPPLMAVLAAPYAPTGYHYRYIVWMVVPLVVWLAAGAASGRPTATAAALAFVGLSMLATLNRHTDPRYAEDDFHAVVEVIAAASGDATPAVVAAPLYFGEGVLYSLPADWPATNTTAHPDAEQDWETRLPAFAATLTPGQPVWLVTQWFPPGHPQRSVCDALAQRLDATLVERVSSTVMVYRTEVAALRTRKTDADTPRDVEE